MTKLLFVRQPQVYLPEIKAYTTYLAKHRPDVQVYESTDLKSYDSGDYDVLWHFMGMDMNARGNYVVHEYNSLSTQPFATLKDSAKKLINAKPDQRVFLNRIVQTELAFKDGVPSYLRDMGIGAEFFNHQRAEAPKYDFILAGGLNRGHIIRSALEHFDNYMPEARVLLVGNPPPVLRRHFKHNKNIIFYGRVSYDEVPHLMSQARYGLNLMPDVYPFNRQTATKVLEYAALGLQVVTTDYKWMRRFESRRKCKLFKLAPDFSNFSMEALEAYDFIMPDVNHLGWDDLIEKSGIFSFL